MCESASNDWPPISPPEKRQFRRRSNHLVLNWGGVKVWTPIHSASVVLATFTIFAVVHECAGRTGRIALTNTEAKAAYLMVMLDYYEQETPPPDNDAVLATITGLPMDQWLKYRPEIADKSAQLSSRWATLPHGSLRT